MAKGRAFVSVPASSGNVGIGFDVLGLALSLRNEVHARVIGPAGAPVIRVEGEGERSLPLDARNAVFATMKRLFARAGRRMPRLEIRCVNRVPLARGLGSSSAAYLAALLAANRLMGDRFSREEILDIATELEGHPDNVAPALYGGLRASGVFKGRVVSAPMAPPRCRLVVAVPAFELSTRKARAVLPSRIPLKDAVFNLSAATLLPHALARDERLLTDLLQDRLHEPYRAKLIPGFHKARAAAVKAGAFGMTLSGAGPTLLGFVPAGKTAKVAAAMKKALASARVRAETMELSVDRKGAIVR